MSSTAALSASHAISIASPRTLYTCGFVSYVGREKRTLAVQRKNATTAPVATEDVLARNIGRSFEVKKLFRLYSRVLFLIY